MRDERKIKNLKIENSNKKNKKNTYYLYDKKKSFRKKL